MKTPNTLTETQTVSDMFKFRRRLPGAGVVAMLGLVLAGCAGDAELDTLKPESGTADEIYDLAFWVFIIAGVVLVAVCGAVLWLAV